VNSSAPASSSTTVPARRRTSLLVAFGVVVLLAAVLAWHAVAHASFERAGSSSRPLAQRASAATRAHAMEPWNEAYDRRSRLLGAWLLGEQQLARGDYEAAVQTLDTAYRLDVGNTQLLALDHKAQDEQALASNRKAHLQHGHEGPGGTLQPQDVER